MTRTLSLSESQPGRTVAAALDLLPHVFPFVEAVGFFGLEPRTRELAALAVARTGGCDRVAALHRLIGRAAGLTSQERAGDYSDLTAAERSAVALALGTVSRPGDPADHADQHFTSEQIRQLQAVALAVDLHCRLAAAVRGGGPAPAPEDS